VTLVSRRREALQAVASEIDGGALVEPCDLSKLEDVEALAGRLLADGGPPDVLVNNAGAGRWLAVDETPRGEAAQMMALPYLAAFELTRALLPGMIERGSGRVVCMTSLAAWSHIPGAAGYSVARWAMRAFASQLREDLRRTGVGVTLIAPSEVNSSYFENNPGTRERIPRAAALLGRAVAPEVVARATADAVERDRNQAIVPRRAEVIVKLTPKPLFDLLVSRTGWRRPI
jgi:short-subunit dehydrogenase